VALYRSDAFVLRTYKLGENDQIIVFFTRDYGKLRAVARRSHHPRRQTSAYYQPLMLLNIIVFGRSSQALYRINTVDIVQALRPLHEDFTLLRYGLYITELVDVTTHEQDAVPEVFGLYQQSLEQLTSTPHPTLLLRLFELRLLMVTGYTPQIFTCVRCGRALQPHECTFSPALGGLLCSRCHSGVPGTFTVSPASLIYLRRAVTEAGIETAAGPQPDAATHKDIERLLHAHLTVCLGRELKSYAFLQL
jgi:DNA repair protein RecO (recombination protein O)